MPSTSEVEARLDALRAELAALQDAEQHGVPLANGVRFRSDLVNTRPTEHAIAQAERELEQARERDALQAGRPEGCWCLGTGGRGERYISTGVYAFAEPCSCPEAAEIERVAAAERKRVAAERSRARVAALFAEARIPKRFEAVRFATYPATDATRAAAEKIERWYDPPADDDEAGWAAYRARPRSLFIYGPFGTGKTCLAVALLKKYLAVVEGAGLFITVPSLLERIRRTYDGGADASEHEVIDLVKRVELLVLDDLGAERVTDWVAEKLFTIINHRHDEDLPTVFTSNLSPADLGRHIGERTTWRVIEMSEVVKLDGPNLRDRLP